ncbi:hypothetical protein Taro_003830 [Colocasia esculenta]|uniref:Uncharacterized protein n=1 Tax=Colocasia esculenta TaxID=4460 RepID=A0A843TMS4_COLES|nr:hypothetical protein [Colocasia esculenta]
MWTLRVAVAVGGIGVDANLRILQLAAPVSLKLPTGSEEWLDDRRTRGVAELREETSRRGAILGGARGGLGVNREIVGGSSLEQLESPQSRIRVSAGYKAGELGVNIVRARRTSHDHRPAQGCAVAVQGQYLQRCSPSCVVLQQCSFVVVYFLQLFLGASARSREADSDQVRYRFNGLGRGIPSQLVLEQEISEMADRRDWGGGGDDPEESTQRMIERIWESLTDIRARMDQQAPVPPVAVPPGDGEAVPVAPVPPRVEVPFVAPVPPPPPVQLAEEPVMQVERFLRLQPPTYSGGPNPDTAEHWVHEIERVFATMRCSAADKVVLAAY